MFQPVVSTRPPRAGGSTSGGGKPNGPVHMIRIAVSASPDSIPIAPAGSPGAGAGKMVAESRGEAETTT